MGQKNIFYKDWPAHEESYKKEVRSNEDLIFFKIKVLGHIVDNLCSCFTQKMKNRIGQDHSGLHVLEHLLAYPSDCSLPAFSILFLPSCLAL